MKKLRRKFEEYLRSTCSVQTINSYTRVVDQFIASQPDIERSGYQEIMAYAHKLRRNRGHSRLGREICALKKLYDFLLSEGRVKLHPCRKIKVDSGKIRGKCFSKLLNRSELSSLMEREERYQYTASRNRVLIGMLVYLGLMPSEIIQLRISDLDFSMDQPRIRIQRSRKLSGRLLKLNDQQINPIQDYLKTRSTLNSISKNLFLSIRGDHFTVDALNALIESQKPLVPGKLVNCSKIRESVISNWLNVDHLDLGQVQYMAGHKWPSSTEKYINPISQEVKVNFNLFHPMNTKI